MLLIMLTPIQEEIVKSPLGAAIVTAGAGSGKTRVLTNRIAHLIDTGIPDWAIVALTFTNKAANEMRERIERMRGGRIETFLGTFHSFCLRLLKKNIHHLEGFTENFSIYDEDDSIKVIKEILKSSQLEYLDKDSYKQVRGHISKMKNQGLSIAKYKGHVEHMMMSGELIDIMERYEARLIESNALDFDDLLCKTLELFEKAPDVLATLQRRFQYILVDEFQDTNKIQYQIVKKLAAGHGNIMAVGDEDQCIYTWRGASAENLGNFIDDFNPQIFKLEQNFRSGKKIVSLANQLIQHNETRLDKVLFSELDAGEVRLERYYDEREEARNVIYEIMKRVQNEGCCYSDFAILLRVNALSRVFEEQLRTYQIPHTVYGGFKFYERKEVKQALCYLKLLVNPRDNNAFGEVVNFPKRAVGQTSIDRIREYGVHRGQSCLEATPSIIDRSADEALTPKARTGLAEFFRVHTKLAEVYESDGLVGLADEFLEITKLREAWLADKEGGDERVRNLYELVGAIRMFAAENPEANLAGYLQTVSLDVGDQEVHSRRVIISTIHSAKGLEFNNVFLVGLEEDIFPLRRRDSEMAGKELEEERRLMYVAITRARERLDLSYAQTRFQYGERKLQRPSMFLEECGFEASDYF